MNRLISTFLCDMECHEKAIDFSLIVWTCSKSPNETGFKQSIRGNNQPTGARYPRVPIGRPIKENNSWIDAFPPLYKVWSTQSQLLGSNRHWFETDRVSKKRNRSQPDWKCWWKRGTRKTIANRFLYKKFHLMGHIIGRQMIIIEYPIIRLSTLSTKRL